MGGYNPSGGKSFGTPDFQDAVPPDPPKQGDARVGQTDRSNDEYTFADGQPDARVPMGQDSEGGIPAHQNYIGYYTTPIRGTFMPGQAKDNSVERSAMSGRDGIDY